MSKENSNYNGIKAGLWYTVGNMLIKGIPFLTLPIFTRLLSTADFGIYNTYISYENIISILICLGISGTIKVAKSDFKEKFEQYVSSVFRLILLIGGFSLIVFNIISYFLDYSSSWASPSIINLLIMQSVATAIYSVMACKYVIDGKYIENLVITFIMTGINVGLSLFLCYFWLDYNRANARIVGTAIGGIIVAIYIIIVQRKKAKLIKYEEAYKYALKLGIPLIPHQLSISLLSQCDKIMIQGMVGNSEAGIYGLAVNITMVISVLLTSIDNAWTPWFYKNLELKDYETLKDKNRYLVVFFMFLTSSFIFVSPEIIHIISRAEYWDSLYAVIPLIISVFLNFMYIFGVGVEYFYKKTGYISLTTIICSVVNIILNYVLISSCGYIAAAYATCLSKFLLFVLHYYRSKKLISGDIVELKCLVFNLIIVILIGILTTVLVNLIIVRYLLFIIFASIVLYFFYKKGMLNKFVKLKKN